ncbi:tetratricopeptide repeat protein [Chamaesiphon sp. VAR_48_metabat_403]|uniref:tetratricopeptide repeat protein n=1 Tax=Chamaesiphon sp. VAR_48_metabat_403 TaxID=2964700 RepID=UPI00286DD58D|nr:tetratricopeptide repeat protein [Chamaesiphon sp. VAR_48_metabat_403]
MKSIQTAILLFALASAVELCQAERVFGYVLIPELTRTQISIVPATNSLFDRGLQKQEQEDYAGAIEDYTEFLKTNPNHSEGYSNRGFAKAMLDKLQEALQDFDRAIALAPNNADAYNARGNVNAMAGNLSASIQDFNRSIRYNRNFADAYYNRAISRHSLGDRRGAKLDLSKAAKLFQQQQDLGGYQQAREWIDKLK